MKELMQQLRESAVKAILECEGAESLEACVSSTWARRDKAMLLQENPVRAHRVRLAGIPVSEVCFGTEHINRSVPEFGAGILENAARLHGITFWDTDNAYGSQTQVAAACAASPGGDRHHLRRSGRGNRLGQPPPGGPDPAACHDADRRLCLSQLRRAESADPS